MKKKKSDSRWGLTKFGLKLLLVYLGVNFFVQLGRKPTEFASFAGFKLRKSPESTWRNYREYFRDSATDFITPDFLAALAHLESGGNPWASPGWRVHFNSKPFDIYTPASSAVGLYQFLDETFRDASKACLNQAYRASSGAAATQDQCRSFALPTSRLSPQVSTQVAANYLYREVSRISQEQGLRKMSPERLHSLAAIVHLCGKGKAATFARSGFSWSALGNCGPHNPHLYVQQLLGLKRSFAELQRHDDTRAVAAANR